MLKRFVFKSKEFSRSDYLKIVGNISTATASRDLQQLKDDGQVKIQGDKYGGIFGRCRAGRPGSNNS